jgi:phosphate transport system substrate-binding protein
MKRAVAAVFAALVAAALVGAGALAPGCGRRGPEGEGGVTGPGVSVLRGSIEMKGSDTMVNLGQHWAATFMDRHPEVEVAVAGGGSGTGIAALINGTTDIAQASRAMKGEEKEAARARGVDPYELVMGSDAIVVAVHPRNPIDRLSVDQLSDIFTGRVRNWSEVGGTDAPILLLSRERNSGTHVFFLEQVLRKGDREGKQEYAAEARMMPATQAIVDEVAVGENAIGYLGMGYFDAGRVKAVAVAETAAGPYVEPTAETAASGEYPISRPLFWYTNGAPQGVAKAFLDFALGDEGQSIVMDEGFVGIGH